MKATQLKQPTLPTAMAFYHGDGLVAAWKQASQFAGKGGHVATLPEVVQLRLNSAPGAIPWERYFTTASAEYVGIGLDGRRLLIVAHGVGPMATLDGILKAYSHHFNDKTRNNRGGRINQQEFWDLEQGKYGPVSIVDLEAYIARYEYPFMEFLQYDDACTDTVLLARLGDKAKDYCAAHRDHAKQYHLERGHGKRDPYILQVEAASNCHYLYYPLEEGMAFAHLLSIGGLANVSHEHSRVPSLACDVGCHEWSNGVRLAGVRADSSLDSIHEGPDVQNLLHRNWRNLMQPIKEPKPIGFRALMRVGKEWFTHYPKQGACMDSYEPEFHVLSAEKVGGPVEFRTTIGGYHMFVKYGIKEVEAIAPPGANAYAMVGEPWIVKSKGDPSHHAFRVQFYHLELDNTQRLMRAKQLAGDYNLLMELMFNKAATQK